MKRRSIAITALFLVLFLMLPSCSDTAETSQGDPPSGSGTQPESAGESARKYAEIPDEKFEGYVFNVLARGAECNEWESRDIQVEALTGDLVNDAVYMRNKALEDRLGVTIKAIKHGWELLPIAQKSHAAGDNAYDAYQLSIYDSSLLAAEGYLADFNTLEYPDLSKEWWDQSARKGLSIGGKLYFATGDITIMDKDATWVMAFNKKMIEDLALESPYTLIQNNQWTFDKVLEMQKNASRDLNNDGVYDREDIVGMVSHDYSVKGYYVSSGEMVARKDAEDYPYLSMNNERLTTVIEKSIQLAGIRAPYSICLDVGPETWELTKTMFAENRTLFISEVLQVVMHLRAMETPFGIIPHPKLDAAQDSYHTAVNQVMTLYSVPSNAPDIKRTGIILEAMANESMYTLTPAYYDLALKEQLMRDAESTEMLDIILKTRVFDLGELFKWGNLSDQYVTLIRAGDTGFTSVYEASATQAQTDLDKTVEAFKK